MASLNNIGSHKTSVFTENSITKVCYHNTIVVSFDYNKIKLNTGGWFSNTTKTRMNQTSNQFGLGFRVYQKNYDWYVEYNNKIYSFEQNQIEFKRS